MILEVAMLTVESAKAKDFEAAFQQTQAIIASMEGYISHQLQKCIEREDAYLLLVQRQKIEDHSVGFRQSAEYQQWRELLHHFYNPFPTVEHYELVMGSEAKGE